MKNRSMYRGEHYFAWLLALGSVVFGVIGALVAFDVFDIRSLRALDDGQLPSAGTGNDVQNFTDGILLILPGIVLAFLAMTLHANDHHTPLGSRHDRLWTLEHGASYVTLIGALAMAGLGVLVGYDLFDTGATWRDGVVFQLLAIGAGVLTATLHSVGHHAAIAADDDIRVIVEERVGFALTRAGTMMASTGRPATALANGAVVADRPVTAVPATDSVVVERPAEH